MTIRRSERLRGPQSAQLRAALYHARQRRLGRLSGSGGGSSYSQNLYTGKTHITGSGTPMDGATKFEFSMWAAPDFSHASQIFLFSSDNDSYVVINSNGTVQVKLDSKTSTDLWFFISNETIPADTLTHIYISLDLDAVPVSGKMYIDGVEVDYGAGTEYTAPNIADGSGLRWPQLDILALVDNLLDFTGQWGDFWGDAPATLNGIDAFIDGSGNPKDLSGLPTPLFWFGGDQVAADILNAENNGSYSPLSVWASSTLTDV